MSQNQKQVLIVGAGPTGLTAAVELSRLGLVPKIIDHKDAPSPLSRAVGIMPASLNILTPSGVTDHLVEEGIKMRFAQIFKIDKRLARIALNGGHPDWGFAIALAQDRTEHALIEGLKRFGGSVEFESELTGIRQEGERVFVNINNGPDEEYDYVLGADGIHSATRNLLGIDYPGFDLPETWSIADVDAVNWPYPEAGTICILPKSEVAFIVPLETNRYRIVSNTEDALATLPLKLEVTNKHREGQFTISIRQVKEYRKGNVFLAGDAAHCHSPAGGRGMNLGIADAAEWAGRIIKNDLEGYSQSRHEAGKSTIAVSERMRKTATSTNPLTKFGLTIFGILINIFPPLKYRLAKTFLSG
ncbi:MAG: FAD-dependent oxidoreductase [Thermodesulfobacteriota bacterium]